tara:strand:- start:22825 stop:27495 length:4671 start_codon:yes stop_codon:yes gene_type:complete
MGRIKNKNKYPLKVYPKLTDYVIGSSDESNGETVNFEIGTLTGVINGGGLPDGILSGAYEWVEGTLSFKVLTIVYRIGGIVYSTDPTTVTLDVGGALARKDVIAVNTDRQVFVIKGGGSVTPAKPVLTNANLSLEFTFVDIAASATVPTGVASQDIYDEGLGLPAEFTATESTGNTTIQLDSNDNSNTGTKAIKFQSPLDGETFSFSTDTPVTVNFGDYLQFWMRIEIPHVSGQKINIKFYNGVNIVSNTITVVTGFYNFVGDLVNEWQLISIPYNSLGFTGVEYDKIECEIGINPFRPQGQFYIDSVVRISGLAGINDSINHSSLFLDDGTNPHGTTKDDVGLGNVDNTSDLDKPISTATQTALDLKANDDEVVHLTGNEVVSGVKTLTDELILQTVLNAVADTDKFLVSDGGEVKYRTGAQLLSDIGAAASAHTHVIADVTDFTDNSSNWDTAFGWGDHALVGYLDGFVVGNSTFISLENVGTATVPQITALLSATGAPSSTTFLRGDNTWSTPNYFTPTSLLADYGFTDNSSNWDTAFGWGDHALAGYLTALPSISIKDLSDVLSSMTPSDGQVLTYDSINGWQAETTPAGVTDHTLLSNIGTNTHAQIDTAIGGYLSHAADTSIHFTESSINHANILNVGTNSHAQIDTAIGSYLSHAADTSIHFTENPNWNTAFGWGDHSVEGYIKSGSTNLITEMISTGLNEGGAISINGADPTKFNVSAGNGIVVDHSTSPPTYTEVSWGDFTAQTVTNLATLFATDIAINSAGVIIQQANYSNEELRSLIFLGGLDHSNQTTISNTFSVVVPTKAVGSSVRELARAIGDINFDGNIYSANGANLNIDKSSGLVFSYGRNFLVNVDAPHEFTTPSQTALSFGYVYNNGSGIGTFTAFTTDINVQQFDDGTGTLANTPSNRWVIQRVLYFPNGGTTFIQHSTDNYRREADALDAIPRASFVALAGIKTALVRGYIVVQEGETSLLNATFLSANRFGVVSSLSSGIAATLDTLTDTTITSLAASEILKWDGTAWINNTLAEAGIESAFTKNTAFNKNFGVLAGEVAEGNDSRINNGQTAFSWGNHAGLYLPIATQLAQTKASVTNEFLNSYNATTGLFTSAQVAYSGLSGIPSTFTPIAHTLDSHSNVNIKANSAGEILKWDGAAWVNNTLAEAGISAVGHTHTFASLTAKPTTIAGYGITDYNSLWDTRLATKSTTDLAEGTNLYYTDTRVGAKITTDVNKAFIDALNVDADTIDGIDSGSFLRSDIADTKTNGDLIFNNNISLKFGNTLAISEFFSDASDLQLKISTGDFLIKDNVTTRFTFGRATGDFTATGTGTFQGSGDSSFVGKVGIGTNSPTHKLDVTDGSALSMTPALKLSNPNDGNGSGTGIEFAAVSSSIAKAAIYFEQKGVGNGRGTLYFATDAISDANTVTVSDYVMAIDYLGNVGIGNDTPIAKLDVTGTGRFTSTVTATNFILSSDKRLKKNIKDVDTKEVIVVDWKTFELKEEEGQKRYGVIAQELEENHPEFVRTDKEGIKSVAYIDLLIAKIAELEARLEKAGI